MPAEFYSVDFSDGFSVVMTVVCSVCVLFSGLESGSVVVVLTVLLIIPAAVGLTVRLNPTVSPAATLAVVQFTTPVVSTCGVLHVQFSGASIDRKVTLEGRESVITTFVAGAGPLLIRKIA